MTAPPKRAENASARTASATPTGNPFSAGDAAITPPPETIRRL